MPIQKQDFLDKVKEREDCNRRNTFRYFEDYNLSVTQRLFKGAVSGWVLISFTSYTGFGKEKLNRQDAKNKRLF